MRCPRCIPLALILVAALVCWAPAVAHAQEALPNAEATATPTPPPQPTGPNLDGLGQSIAHAVWDQFTSGFGQWLDTLPGVQVAKFLLRGLGALAQMLVPLGNGDGTHQITTRFDPALTYAHPAVRARWELGRTIANGALGLVLVWLGYLVACRGLAGKELLWVLGPRLLTAAVLINTVDAPLAKGTDLANALAGDLGGTAGAAAVTTALQRVDGTTAAGVLVVCGGVAAAGLFVSRLFAHALYDVLFGLGSPAVLVWAVPQWSKWASRWFGLLMALFVGQLLTAAALGTGADLLAATLAKGGPWTAGEQAFAAGTGLATLVLATAGPAIAGAGVATGGFGMARVVHTAARVAAGRRWGHAGGGGPWEQEPAAPARAYEVGREQGGAAAGGSVAGGPRVIDVTWRPVLPAPAA